MGSLMRCSIDNILVVDRFFMNDISKLWVDHRSFGQLRFTLNMSKTGYPDDEFVILISLIRGNYSEAVASSGSCLSIPKASHLGSLFLCMY